MTQEKLLTIGDVAQSLRIHRSYVYKLIKSGSLPQPIKLGKASRIAVDPRIESSQSWKRPEDEMAIMDHAVRVASRLAIKFLVCLSLETGAQIITGIAVRDRGQRRDNRQGKQHE